MALPPTGLYMVFGEKPFARLQRGTGSEFDVFPAQVTSSSIRYALALGEKWVMFDIESQQVILVDKPRELSLFAKQSMKNPKIHPHIVYIALGDNHQLRMDGSKFRPHDLPDSQTSGLSMVTDKRPVSRSVEFERFVLTSDALSSFISHLSLTNRLPRSRQQLMILKGLHVAQYVVVIYHLKLDEGVFTSEGSCLLLNLFHCDLQVPI